MTRPVTPPLSEFYPRRSQPIRTEWIVDNEQIAAAVERETGRTVASVWRGSGLYARVTFEDGQEITIYDGQRLYIRDRK